MAPKPVTPSVMFKLWFLWQKCGWWTPANRKVREWFQVRINAPWWWCHCVHHAKRLYVCGPTFTNFPKRNWSWDGVGAYCQLQDWNRFFLLKTVTSLVLLSFWAFYNSCRHTNTCLGGQTQSGNDNSTLPFQVRARIAFWAWAHSRSVAFEEQFNRHKNLHLQP